MAFAFANSNGQTASPFGVNPLACPIKAHSALKDNEDDIMACFGRNEHRDAIPFLKKRLRLVQSMKARAFLDQNAFKAELELIIQYSVDVGYRFAHLTGDENVPVLEETLETAFILHDALPA